ncbi:MAG: SufE family protein, partial [Alphaproteobacteria bacterium]
MTVAQQAEDVVAEFAFFDDWEERYQHLIDLGRRLPPLDETY